MGWQPGQGLGRSPDARTVPVLPQLKWDKGGIGASTHVRRLGPQAVTFRRACVPAGNSDGVAAPAAAAGCSITRQPVRSASDSTSGVAAAAAAAIAAAANLGV